MFQNHYGIRVIALHALRVVRKDVHAALVVVGSGTFVALLVCEALGEVETETVHVIFFHKILQAFLHMLTERLVLVIPVVEHAVRMRSIDIEPRIVGCSLVVLRIPVKFRIRMCTGRLIVNDIHDYGHTPGMTTVNELLVHITRTIGLVESEI